ncbi:SulP family inorganic anion transporter [Hylemonella gracilis]|uniref:SulP family inorganic anion transporter n=1 Tax=Hylemonella gracilis TaxID=80880 RepID=A0A4P6UL47_9BURK|nr:SulP family inorganic anion transporter [Hylemonella gracilis]QBK04880.1 SulP family inorganic anion transporter [Hylemonella gracilis]
MPSPSAPWRARLPALFPFLNWPRPNASLLRGEALAGLTVGLMLIPQSVAYATLAGMPPVTGIYAAILPAIAAVLFSSSTRLAVGPTALTGLLVGAGLAGAVPGLQPGSVQWVQLAIWLALLSGLLQLLLGFMRFGWLLNVVNAPVLTAFTQAAAWLIIGSQLRALTGLDAGSDWLGLLTGPQAFLAAIDARALAFGAGTLAWLVLARRWRPGFPAVLLAVLATAGGSYLMSYEASGGAVVGALPAGLPSLVLPTWPGWELLGALLLPTLVITLISFLETASSAKVDHERSGTRWDQDQDLIGQGLGKIAAGFSGAFPVSSSFSRSALNLYAGARTGWSTVFSAVVVLLALLFFVPVLHHVPQAVLAAIVVTAVLGLIKPREFMRLWRVARAEAVIAVLTFAVTLLAAPQLYWGVLTGVVLSLGHFLYTRLHPRIIEVGLHPDGSLRDRHLWHLPPLAPHTSGLRMDAALDFASAAEFERAIVEHLAAHPDTRHLVVFAQSINRLDATGAETFLKIAQHLREQQVLLHVSGMKLPVEQTLLRAGWKTHDPAHRLYRTDAEALAALTPLREGSAP